MYNSPKTIIVSTDYILCRKLILKVAILHILTTPNTTKIMFTKAKDKYRYKSRNKDLELLNIMLKKDTGYK